MSEKRFDPTPARLARARREGDVAISQELCNAIAFACGLAGCTAAIGPIGSLAQAAIAGAARNELPAASIIALLCWMMLPAALACAGSALAAVAQTGGLHFVMPKCDLRKLAPNENLKRMFSRESAVTAARSLLAFLCASAALIPVALQLFGAAMHASGTPVLASLAWTGALHAAMAACCVGAIFAAADYALQRMRRLKRLRMSLDEMRREHKDTDGDPLARSRRKAMHQAIARSSVSRVKEAALVVTNPTHIAIALEYRPPHVAVPRVLVSAADEGAAEVRRIAREHGVPLVENIPLARELWARCKPGDVIPSETYVAVAEIVAALARTGALQ